MTLPAFTLVDDDGVRSPWVSDTEDDDDEDIIEYRALCCPLPDAFAGECNACSANSWNKVRAKSRHSAGRVRNHVFSHCMASSLHDDITDADKEDVCLQFEIHEVVITPAERRRERAAYRKHAQNTSAAASSSAAPRQPPGSICWN